MIHLLWAVQLFLLEHINTQHNQNIKKQKPDRNRDQRHLVRISFVTFYNKMGFCYTFYQSMINWLLLQVYFDQRDLL